eukprot:gene5257-404_t
MASVYVPSKLLNLCIRKVAEKVEDNIDEIELLPEEVKVKLLHLVSKRGSLSDENIGKILHGNVIEIDLSHSEVTDAGLKEVSDKGLEFISLGCCTSSLVEIHVGYCKDVTDNGIELIVNSCPNIRILIFHGCPLTTERSREMIGLLGRAMRQLSWTVY